MSAQYHIIVFHTGGRIGHTVGPEPSHDKLAALVGGYIEYVPGFVKCSYEGVIYEGYALCNEDARSQELEINPYATCAWLANLRGPFRYKPELFGTVVFLSKA